MAKAITDKLLQACDKLAGMELGGIRLEDGDPSLLNVAEHNLDTHVAIQPAAIAYYGFLKKEASRKLHSLKRGFDRWEKKKWAEAKASLGAGTGKSTVADIEARHIIDNEAELEKWDRQLDAVQLEFDTIEAWFEAWRQKSFSIREYAGIVETESFNTSPFMGDNAARGEKTQSSSTTESSIHRIRRMLRERKAEGSKT